MQRDDLNAFLQDEAFREKLKNEHNLDDEEIDNISMTSSEEIVELMVIKKLIKKDSRITINVAAAQINTYLDNIL